MLERSSGSSDLPSPSAPRLRRPGWRDPRLAFGLLLVAGSVALGSWAVSSAGQTVAVYAVAQTATPGDVLTSADLVSLDVRLGADASRYFLVSDPLPETLVALRPVGERELLSRSSVGSGEALEFRSVAVPVAQSLSSKVVAGSVVDLWWVPAEAQGSPVGALPVEQGAASVPSLLADGLVVAELEKTGGSGLLTSGAPTVQVLVPTKDLAEILGALAGDGTVAIMPVPGFDR
ncbi:hypothetical protein [Sanguibacter antarcticus]|uniref:SAF domain-containing protein n=1 Tax=Sanguibacter antarcticus TaxID=372484 RepID=A0A2A9E0V7_9MICO|nr:hypothetical protein [Sanguibacter antarcticus]PFG32578.1 hypothetical protein ATL42_0418 [Sanguibacter antarcticus]